jgi:hypothetical protein
MMGSGDVYVRGGDQIVSGLMDVIERAAMVVSESAQRVIEEQHERLVAEAEADEQWAGMAGDIQYWADEQGNLAYGVPETSPRYRDAMRTEYGDPTHAPSPLIRMGVVNGVTQMGWSMQQAFLEAGYR